ncbi:hypothetical protein HBB16_18510 [Pseudonocardia sp. MCCB 268]|nr:hypothetical protein [Pseudonocardia cytotoxica]
MTDAARAALRTWLGALVGNAELSRRWGVDRPQRRSRSPRKLRELVTQAVDAALRRLAPREHDVAGLAVDLARGPAPGDPPPRGSGTPPAPTRSPWSPSSWPGRLGPHRRRSHRTRRGGDHGRAGRAGGRGLLRLGGRSDHRARPGRRDRRCRGCPPASERGRTARWPVRWRPATPTRPRSPGTTGSPVTPGRPRKPPTRPPRRARSTAMLLRGSASLPTPGFALDPLARARHVARRAGRGAGRTRRSRRRARRPAPRYRPPAGNWRRLARSAMLTSGAQDSAPRRRPRRAGARSVRRTTTPPARVALDRRDPRHEPGGPSGPSSGPTRPWRCSAGSATNAGNGLRRPGDGHRSSTADAPAPRGCSSGSRSCSPSRRPVAGGHPALDPRARLVFHGRPAEGLKRDLRGAAITRDLDAPRRRPTPCGIAPRRCPRSAGARSVEADAVEQALRLARSGHRGWTATAHRARGSR